MMRSSKNSRVPGYSFGIFLKFLCTTTFMQNFIARAQLVQNLSWGWGGSFDLPKDFNFQKSQVGLGEEYSPYCQTNYQ